MKRSELSIVIIDESVFSIASKKILDLEHDFDVKLIRDLDLYINEGFSDVTLFVGESESINEELIKGSDQKLILTLAFFTPITLVLSSSFDNSSIFFEVPKLRRFRRSVIRYISFFKGHAGSLDQDLRHEIEFSPKNKRAGIQILSYFQDILNQKYPDIEATVKISQNGNTVTMEIETPDGQRELIKKTFEEYQLVISGNKPPEEFLDNKLHIAQLENEVRVAVMRAENAQNLLQVQSDVIDELKQDKQDLKLQLAAALQGQNALQKDLTSLVEAVINNNNVEHVFRMLELHVGDEPSDNELAELRKELESIKAKNPKGLKTSLNPCLPV